MKKRAITRRDFLRVAAMSPFAGAFACGSKKQEKKKAARRAKVVLIRDKNALISFKKPNPRVIQKMLDDSITTLLGEADPVSAWKKLVKPSDIVGIKSNVWGPIPTTREVEQTLKARIMDAGVAEENIGIDDRGVRRNRIFKNATVIINARPARTHHWSGMGGCIKNPIMFVPWPPAYHGDSCADLATLWYKHNLKERTKLNVLLMLNPQFHGIGPHNYSDKYVWEYKGILVSQDPVAVDAMGVLILQAKRREYFGEDRPLQPPAKHIYLADTRHNLGVSDPDKIELIKLGWEEGILI
ncbi:MAG: DUF362 domain-containing protein [Candidatus Aminicenantes bacterium]|nr:DUF362 domain-containing protein [Candidatus Aminicenantes bacterium]